MLGTERRDGLSAKKGPLSERLHRRDISACIYLSNFYQNSWSAYSDLPKWKADQSSVKKPQTDGRESSRTSRLESSRGRSRVEESGNVTGRSGSQTSRISKSKTRTKKLGTSLLPGFVPLIDDDPYGQSSRQPIDRRTSSRSNSFRRKTELSRTDESDQSVDLKACFALVKKAMVQPNPKKKILKRPKDLNPESGIKSVITRSSEQSKVLKSKKKLEIVGVPSVKSSSGVGLFHKLANRVKKELPLTKLDRPQPPKEAIFRVMTPQLQKHQIIGELKKLVARPTSPTAVREKSKSKESKKLKVKPKSIVVAKSSLGAKKSTRASSPKGMSTSAVTPSQISKNLAVLKSNNKSTGRPRKMHPSDDHDSKDYLVANFISSTDWCKSQL